MNFLVFASFLAIMAVLFVPFAHGNRCAIKASGIRFRPETAGPPRSFFLKEYESFEATRGAPLPGIIIQVLDSDGVLDSTLTSNFAIKASVVNAEQTLGGDTNVEFHLGEAHFTNLTFLRHGSMILQFTVVAQDKPCDGHTLTTGIGTVAPFRIQKAYLSFSPTKSFFKFHGEQKSFAIGVPLPPIRVLILDSAYAISVPSTGIVENSTVQAVMASPDGTPVTILNGVASAIEGVAVFKSLIITSTSLATVYPPLVFKLLQSNLTTQTGAMSITPIVDSANIAFESQEYSFIYTEGQELQAHSGTKFPRIVVRLYNSLMQPDSVNTGLVISATCDRVTLIGGVVGMVDGVATFEELQFSSDTTSGVTHDEFRPYVITFTAGSQGNLPVNGKRLQTGKILVSKSIVPAYTMQFLRSPFDSFFNSESQEKQVALHLTVPPIRIELLGSDNRLTATSSLSLAVFVEASGSTLEKAGVAYFSGGVATFSTIKFVAVDKLTPPRLSFTVRRGQGVSESLGIYDVVLRTGFINLTRAVSNFDMRFQLHGVGRISRPYTPLFATMSYPISPPIVVELLNSAGSIDSSSSEISITASAPGAVLSGNFMRVSSGVAIFDQLTFLSDNPGTFVVTFTAGPEGNAPVAGKTLLTGPLTAVNVLIPRFAIRFTNDSYIQHDGHTVPLTLGVPIPTISVELVNSVNKVTQAELLSNETSLMIKLEASRGTVRTGSPIEQLVVNGRASFTGVIIDDAFDPVITLCAESIGAIVAADGWCVSSGSLPAYSKVNEIGGLTVLGSNGSQSGLTVSIERTSQTVSIFPGERLQILIGVIDSAGRVNFTNAARVASETIGLKVAAESTVPLRPPFEIDVDDRGVAYFSDLQFANEIPVGAMPIVTFTAKSNNGADPSKVPPITTGFVVTLRTYGLFKGVDVVAEILVNKNSFDWAGWRDRLAHRLNIESERIVSTRISDGTSSDYDPSLDEISQNQVPSWRGTRVDFRFIEPLPTSRNTKPAVEIADFFASLIPNCSTGDLFLRRVYRSDQDTSCDWYVFDDQLAGARACTMSAGESGYCACHLPLFKTIGKRCLGLEQLTSLCLNILIPLAKCAQPEIIDVCKKLEFPDAPRAGLAGSAAFIFLFLPPLVYLHYSGFFHKLDRPRASQNKIQILEDVRGDHLDMM